MTTQASDTCFSTTDHWWAFQLIKQKAAEWHGTLCVAAHDVKNAPGTVEHRISWKALYEEVKSHIYRCSHNKYGTPTLSLTHTHSNMLFHPAAILLPLKRILCQFRFSLEFCSRRTEYSFFGGALRKSFASSRDSWTILRRTTREIGRRCCTIASTTKCTTRRKSLFAQTRKLTLLVLVVLTYLPFLHVPSPWMLASTTHLKTMSPRVEPMSHQKFYKNSAYWKQAQSRLKFEVHRVVQRCGVSQLKVWYHYRKVAIQSSAAATTQVFQRLQHLEQAATEQLNARRGAENALVENHHMHS